MKNKDIGSILDTATVEEADRLLSGVDTEGDGSVSGERVRRRAMEKCGLANEASSIGDNDVIAIPQKRKTKRTVFRVLAAAAALVLVVGGVIGIVRRMGSENEYGRAVEFFEQYALKTDGLSEKEIRNVYNDIYSNNFADPKTAEVIEASLIERNVSSDTLSSAKQAYNAASALWSLNCTFGSSSYDVRAFVGDSRIYDGEVHYVRDYALRDYNGYPAEFLTDCTFSKYVGDRPVWSCAFPLGYVTAYCPVDDGVIVYGYNEAITEDRIFFIYDCDEETQAALKARFVAEELSKYADMAEDRLFIAKIDADGKLVFKKDAGEGDINSEYPAAVCPAPDGGIAVFLSGQHSYKRTSEDEYRLESCTAFTLELYTAEGERKSSILKICETDQPTHLLSVSACEGGFIALMGSDLFPFPNPSERSIARIAPDGTVTELAKLEGDEYARFIPSSICEYCGKVYISGYEYRSEYAIWNGGRGEIQPLLDSIFDDLINSGKEWDIPSEELTPRVREIYTAKLLVFDPENGIREAASLPGAIGSTLSVGDNGVLIWNADEFVSTFFSPATSSFTIGGACAVRQFRFNETGTLAGVIPTGAMVIYRR